MTAVEVKPWCRKHNRMGWWGDPILFFEDLGGGVRSLVDSVDVIVCEEC